MHGPIGTRSIGSLMWAEHRVHGSPRPRRLSRFQLRGGVAVRSSLDPADLTDGLRPDPTAPVEHRFLAVSGFDVLRVGRLTQPGEVRLRAFTVAGAQPRSLKVQSRGPAGQHGIARELAARSALASAGLDLAPVLHSSGWLLGGRVGFLYEELVPGHHPADARELREACGSIIAELARMHETLGVRSAPLSSVVHPRFLERWTETSTVLAVPADLTARVTDLIVADRDVEVSLGHGDLVASNVLLGGERPVFVDWEFARHQPIAVDLASLLTQARRVGPVLDAATRTHAGVVGARGGSYPLVHQLALAQVQMLTWDTHRRRRAERVGRSTAHDAQRRRLLELLSELLSRS